MKYNVILLIASIFFNFYALFFVYAKANACECAKSDKISFIKGYITVSLVVDSILLYLFVRRHKTYKAIQGPIYSVLVPMAIVYTYVTYIYIAELESKKCTCIEPMYYQILYYVSLIMSILFSVGGIMVVVGFVSIWSLAKTRS